MILLSSFTTVKFGKTLIKLWVEFDKNLVLGNQRVAVERKRPFLGAFSRVFQGVGNALLLITFFGVLGFGTVREVRGGEALFFVERQHTGFAAKVVVKCAGEAVGVKQMHRFAVQLFVDFKNKNAIRCQMVCCYVGNGAIE